MAEAKIQTGTACPFPYAFDPVVLAQVGAANLTAANCTMTFAQVLDPGWSIFEFGMLILFGAIFIPLTLLQIYRVWKFASYKGVSTVGMIQFKLYFTLFVVELLIFIESIDIQGYRGNVSPLVYLLVDELAGVAIVVLSLLTVDYFCKIAEGSLNAKGIPFKVYVLLSFVFGVLLLLLEIIAIVFDEKYFLFEGISLFGDVLNVSLVCLYTWRYVRSIVEFLEGTNDINRRTSSFVAPQSTFKPYNHQPSFSDSKGNTMENLHTLVLRSGQLNADGTRGDNLAAGNRFPAMVREKGFLDRLFADLIPNKNTIALERRATKNNTSQIRFRYETKATNPVPPPRRVIESESSPGLFAKPKRSLSMAYAGSVKAKPAPDPAKLLKKKVFIFTLLLRMVAAVYTVNAIMILALPNYQWAYIVDDTAATAALIAVKVLYALIPPMVFYLFPVPTVAKQFYQQYDLSVSKTRMSSTDYL